MSIPHAIPRIFYTHTHTYYSILIHIQCYSNNCIVVVISSNLKEREQQEEEKERNTNKITTFSLHFNLFEGYFVVYFMLNPFACSIARLLARLNF